MYQTSLKPNSHDSIVTALTLDFFFVLGLDFVLTHRMTELALEVGGEGVCASEEQPVCRHQDVIPGVQGEAGINTGPGSINIIIIQQSIPHRNIFKKTHIYQVSIKSCQLRHNNF